MMFAKEFPKTHPRAGQPTHFVEKIWAGLADQGLLMDGIDFGNYPADFYAYYKGVPKLHTIRAGDRWKVGDVFSPKIWSGSPYRSKTITFAPPLTVVKTWAISHYPLHWTIEGKGIPDQLIVRIVMNDGLSWQDFMHWFPPSAKAWQGQIICWNSNINY